MGLVVHRDLDLERMFESFAVDPKKKAPKKPNEDTNKETKDEKDTDKK